jgi:hypothetical protein
MASPKNSDSTPIPQYQTENVTPLPSYYTATSTIPELQEVLQPEKPTVEPDLNAEKAKKLEDILKNKLSKSYYDYYAKLTDRNNPQRPENLFDIKSASESTSSQSAQYAAMHLTNWLLEAKGSLEPYLKGAFGEALKNALGPIGQALRLLETAEYKLDPRSVHPLLDPYAIDRAARALERQVFSVVKLPFSKAYGLLAHLGMPGLRVLYSSTIIYNEHTQSIESQPVTTIVATPFYQLYQGTEKLADAIDRWTGKPTNALVEHPYEALFIENLDEGIKEWQEARKNKDKNLSRLSLKKINRLIDSHDGLEQRIGIKSDLKNFAKGITRRPLIKLAKNLRRTDRDPLSYLGALLGGIVFDFTVGAVTGALSYAIPRLFSAVPGFNAVRAYATNFIHNSPWTTTSKIFGTNVKNLVRGTLSLNTAASGYLGYQLGSAITPNAFVNVLGVPINIGGGLLMPVTGGLGAFYQTSLLNATQGAPLIDHFRGTAVTMPGAGPVPLQVQWYNQQVYGNVPQYRPLFGIFNGEKYRQLVYSPTDVGGNSIQTNIRYYQNPTMQKVFGATTWNSPISRFSSWLYRHPYFRLPLKGLALSNILLNALPPDVLSIEVAGIPLGSIIKALPFIDYAWQVKGAFFADVAKLMANSRVGQWYGKNIYSPLQARLINLAYAPIEGMPGQGFQTYQGWFKTIRPMLPLQQARPWLQIARNTVNPGFFLGFTFIGPAIASGMNPVVAAIAMPLAGSAVWSGYSWIVSSVSKTPYLKALGKTNALGYLGSVIGALTVPWGAALGIPSYIWISLWTFGTPLTFAVIPRLFPALAGWLTGVGATIYWFVESAALLAGHALGISAAAILGGLGALGIAAAIVSIVGAVLFTGFILFTVFSSFYVPFSEEGATNISSAFKINQSSPQTVDINQTINSCVDFSIIQNPLLLKEFYFYYTAKYNNDVWTLTSGYNDKYEGYTVARQLPSSWQPADRIVPSGTQQLENQINFAAPLAEPQTNDRFRVGLQPVGFSNSTNINIDIGAFGKDNPDQTHQRGKTLTELKDEFGSINQLFTTYLNFLTGSQTQEDKDRQLATIQADIDVKKYQLEQIKTYKGKMEQLQKQINTNKKLSVAIEAIIIELQTKTIPNNLQNKINDAQEQLDQCSDNPCKIHYRGLIKTYSSWNVLSPELIDAFEKLQDLALAAEAANPANPDYSQLDSLLTELIAKLEQAQTDYENQIKSLEALYDEIEKINPTDLTGLTDEEINELLAKNFEVFGKYFYYEPGSTQYKVCVESTFNPDPAKYDLSTPEGLAQAYADASIPIEVAGNQEYIWGLSQPTGIATITLTFKPPPNP